MSQLTISQINHAVSTSVSITKFDFFHDFQFDIIHKQTSSYIAFGYGINRSLFQQRFFPKLSVGTNYFLLDKPKFQLGLRVNYSLSYLNFSKSPNGHRFWNEFYGGLTYYVGQKWKFGQSFLVGYFAQTQKNTLLNRTETHGSFGYNFSICLRYEI